MINRFNILFYFKKPKRHNGINVPIYMRVSTGCVRMEVSTNRKWDPSRWNVHAGRALGKSEDARSLNAHLDTLQANVYEAQRQLIADRADVTIENIRLRLEGRRANSKMFIDVFKDHNEKVKQLIHKDFSPATHERYETAMAHTISFLKWKFKKTDIEIQELNYEFVTEIGRASCRERV